MSLDPAPTLSEATAPTSKEASIALSDSRLGRTEGKSASDLEVGERADAPLCASSATAAPEGSPDRSRFSDGATAASTSGEAVVKSADRSQPSIASAEGLVGQLADSALHQTTPQSAVRSPTSGANDSREEEEEWLLKSIAWPPLPPTPLDAGTGSGEQRLEAHEGLRVRIVCQNSNGPCSLIALCNILILRGDLTVAPGRMSVTYSYLSTSLADYFLRAISSAEAQSSNEELSLEAALSILPQTRYGLNLNPRFDRIDGFSPSSAAPEGELALFALARIPLLHGWLADPADSEVYDALVGPRGCGDYDTALMQVVEGAELAGGAVRLDLHEDAMSDKELIEEAERRSRWSDEESRKVRRAYLINKFLSSTSTQLTYPGLSALCTSSALLPPSGLAALFRNSHLSVLYRRPTLPSPSAAAAPSGPELFTLVTDAAFAREDGIVWESLEDVDGAECAFYDASLRRSSVRGGDWVGSGGGGNEARGEAGNDARGAYDTADAALAQQLQAEEDAHERRLLDRARAEEAAGAGRERLQLEPGARPPDSQTTAAAVGEPRDRPVGTVGMPADTTSGSPPQRRGGELTKKLTRGASGRKKDDKDKCLIM